MILVAINQFYLYKILQKIASVMIMMMVLQIARIRSHHLISLNNLKIDQALRTVKLTQ